MRKIVIFTFFLVGLISCKENYRKIIDISKVSVEVKLERFDVDFYKASTQSLSRLKQKYPLLFPEETHDSVWINKINNKDERELFAETQKVFADFTPSVKELEKLFKYVKYHNPKFKEPKVITMLTNIDYDNRVVYADSLLLISLDAYLGSKHRFYNDYPNYIRLNNHKNHLAVDVANQLINKQLPISRKRRFLDKMIHEGKKMYLLDSYLPSIPDFEKFGVSKEKMDWAVKNEEQIWKYFIDKNYLYDTNSELNKRFLDLAPFSKFYLEEDSRSPGRIGVYIGWEIVRQFMNHNKDVSLQKMIQLNEEQIFKKSTYKPKR